MTLDIGLSMGEVGGDQALVRQLRSAMSTRIEEYVTGGAFGDPAFRLAGELAKSLVFAQVSGADPATYGGYDLVTELERTVTTSGPERRTRRQLLPGSGGATTPTPSARPSPCEASPRRAPPWPPPRPTSCSQQQCSSGYFRIFFTPDPTAAGQSCAEGIDGTDADTTAFVVAQLAAVSSRPPKVNAAIDRAVAWLVATQRADGSFIGSEFTPEPNANSTGLAASALAAAGRCEHAGRPPNGSPVCRSDRRPRGPRWLVRKVRSPTTPLRSRGHRRASPTAPPTWWRTSVQAVAGLTHLRGPPPA